MSYVFDDIEQFISSSDKSKTFKLIYRASRNGCTAEDFHRHCDSKGPTLTVLYSVYNTTYGGYTSASWTSESDVYKNDPNAFLFYKLDSDSKPCVKIPIKDYCHKWAINCDVKQGPAFGLNTLFKDYDLLTFKKSAEKLQNAKGFDLNGCVSINSCYENTGLTSGEVTGGTMRINDLEVYQVLDYELSSNWLEPVQDVKKLKSTLEKLDPCPRLGISNFNILLVGIIGAGKSSFYNTVLSAIKNEIISPAPYGDAEYSITSQLLAYELNVGKKDVKIRMFDTRGFEHNRDPGKEFELLLDGRIPIKYEFLDDNSSLDESRLNPKQELNEQIHLVCFVIDATKIDVLGEEEKLMNKITLAQKVMVAVMTKIDEVCSKVAVNVDNLYKSPKIRIAQEKVSERLGLSASLVFPVCNYKNETKHDAKKDALALHALVKMTSLINSYFETNLVSKPMTDPWISRGGEKLGDKKNFLKLEIHGLIQQCEFLEKTCPVLLVGASNSGKSSYVNSVSTALSGEVCSRAIVGSSSTSKTEKFQMFPLKYKDDGDVMMSLPVKLCDMPGLEKNGGVSINSIKHILKGHVPNKFKIKGNITKTSKHFRREPTPRDKINCVCFVLDISQDTIPQTTSEKLKEIQNMLQSLEIPYLILVTKIDGACSEVSVDVAQVYNSKTIKDKAFEITERMDEKLNKIFPIKNYTHEAANTDDMDVLILESFKYILKLCLDYLEMNDCSDLDDDSSTDNEGEE